MTSNCPTTLGFVHRKSKDRTAAMGWTPSPTMRRSWGDIAFWRTFQTAKKTATMTSLKSTYANRCEKWKIAHTISGKIDVRERRSSVNGSVSRLNRRKRVARSSQSKWETIRRNAKPMSLEAWSSLYRNLIAPGVKKIKFSKKVSWKSESNCSMELIRSHRICLSNTTSVIQWRLAFFPRRLTRLPRVSIVASLRSL